jgi:glycosyltransferase involved in cell wall biosynthesis
MTTVRRRIVAFAYACEPNQGSEPGAGWAWARILARLGEVWVVTRANNKDVIERALQHTPEADTLHFVYVDLPRWARWWKRGQRGVHLYYLLWQLMALIKARQIHRKIEFDLAWHLTLANAWLGSTAALVGPPFVFGPVGAGAVVPVRLFPLLGWRGATFESLRSLTRATSRAANPLARLAWRRATLILVQNHASRDWLPRRHQLKAEVMPNAIAPDQASTAMNKAMGHTALFAGRLIPSKGAGLALQAVSLVPSWRLVVCGSGPDENRLRRLARENGVESRVSFRGWVPRPILHDLMRRADVFLFPSLHDEAGWAVAEALACGLPVVCLDLGGPPVVAGPAGIAIHPVPNRSRLTAEIARRLSGELVPPYLVAAQAASLTLDTRTSEVRALLDRVGLQSMKEAPGQVERR